MIIKSLTLTRYDNRTRVSVLANPPFSNAMLAVNTAGTDLQVHMGIADLRALAAAIAEVLAQVPASAMQEAA